MTGSSNLGLMDAAADTLAGRIEIFSLPTACWGENEGWPDHSILHEKASLPKIKEANRRMKNAMQYGQFPEVVNQENDQKKKELLVNYRSTYFTRDLMQLSDIENLDGLMALFQHLIRSVGSHLEVSNFATEAGISHPTAKKYLNALSQSPIISRIAQARCLSNTA